MNVYDKTCPKCKAGVLCSAEAYEEGILIEGVACDNEFCNQFYPDSPRISDWYKEGLDDLFST